MVNMGSNVYVGTKSVPTLPGWEHQIRDQTDFNRHLDYIHYNPVKHGLCERPDLWPYSTLHRYIKEGKYSCDWAADHSNFEDSEYGE
jgi:putative transposase